MKKQSKLFEHYPPKMKKKLLALRALIFDVSKDLKKSIGPVEETLRWGQPSYVTPVSKSALSYHLPTHSKKVSM